jgi:hypothetical protein
MADAREVTKPDKILVTSPRSDGRFPGGALYVPSPRSGSLGLCEASHGQGTEQSRAHFPVSRNSAGGVLRKPAHNCGIPRATCAERVQEMASGTACIS